MRSAPALHAFAVVGGYSALFSWLFAGPLFGGGYLAESDLYEYYLPIFLSPITTWSSYEFGGLPAFADPGDFTLYPPHFVFARLVGSWAGLAVSAFVLAACFTYAYVLKVTGSRAAAAVAGLSYALSEALMERVPHIGTLHAFAWLPLIVLSIDGLRGPSPRRWLGIGAAGVACCFLAGHPQPAIYIYYAAALYALAGGLAERAPRVYYARVAALFALGASIAAVKALPLVEASFHMARQVVVFTQFASHANSPAQMLALLVPSVLHEGREAPLYVGLGILMLAGVGAVHGRRTWRGVFWVSATLFGLLLGAGDATPVAHLVYELPLMDKFRVGARWLFLAAFGPAVLAGFAVAAIARGAVSIRAALAAAATVMAALAAAAIALRAAGDAVRFEPRAPLPFDLPVWPTGVWMQFAIAAMTAVALTWLVRSRGGRPAVAAFGLVLAADLIYSLPYAISRTGLATVTLAAGAAAPSVHAARLARQLAPGHHRLLAIGGTQTDAVVPAAFARLWRIPIAGGYGPMLLGRHNALALMGTNGSVRPEVLATDDAGLDLLAVKYIVVRAVDLEPPATFDRNGLTWAEPTLELPIGRPDCGHHYDRATSIALPGDVEIASVAIVAHLRCSEHVPQGAEAARLAIVAGSGVREEWPLRAGIEIAERGLGDPETPARARHTAAPLFDDPELPQVYFSRFDAARPAQGGWLEMRAPGTGGWTTIERLTLVDGAGRSWPQWMPDVFLRDTRRWREATRFRTSRASDRGRDEAVPGEEEYIVYENLRVRPRAWIAGAVVPLAEPDMIETVRRSQLPDGRPFDPARMALVDPGSPAASARWEQSGGSARVISVEDGRITVDVNAAAGGFLVLSEAYYPGWRARIGDQAIATDRANVSLQGVAVPPGRHTVVFEFAPTSLRAGAALSIAAAACAAFLAWRA